MSMEEETCKCGHDHQHEHHHDGDCCNHDARINEHEHHHDDDCCCGHDHEHEHHHHDDDDCCCGHDHEHEHHHHDDDCCCGHDHEHEHHHHHEGDSCCGHDHEHEHHHHDDDDCCCGHEHEHEHHHHEGDSCCGGHDHHHHHVEEAPPAPPPVTKAKQRIFVLEALDCPNCAMKMEAKIQAIEGVEYASITFATKQLRVAADDFPKVLPLITAAVKTVEPEVELEPYSNVKVDSETKQEQEEEVKRDVQKKIALIAASAVILFGGTALYEHEFIPNIIFMAMMLFGYLLTGGEVLKAAISNIGRGQIFDENFLMSIATIGAFIIGSYEEALGVMLFFRVGELFEQTATRRSRNMIMDAVDLRPEVVNWVKGDTIKVIPAENADIGDIILVRPGDRVPLDGTIVDGESFMDTSAITGEPVPVSVSVGSEVTSGWVNQNGVIKMRVDQYLEDSMVSRVLDAVENAAASKPKIDKFITRFSRVYTPIVCLISLLTAIIPSLITGDWNYWVYTALTFLVISCPCALVLSVPLAFFCGIGNGSKRGILFKGGAALEAMATVKAVAMDKTGTITKGVFNVKDFTLAGDTTPEQLLSLAASCEQHSNHPIGKSIIAAAKNRNLQVPVADTLKETAGKGISAVIGGKTVLCGNFEYLLESGVDVLPNEHHGTQIHVSQDGQYLGCIVIDDIIKEDAKAAVSRLHGMDIAPAMLTGDAQASAEFIAEQVGISDIHAKLLPGDKLSALGEIRSEYGPVMFVGDGINDAPVLAGADVGAAMGSGADAAIEAADVVFMTGEVSAIADAISIAKRTSFIAKQNVVIALGIKLFVMLLGLLGFANMWTAVFADTGVSMICIMNSIRILAKK